jgi:hypothetical protein
VVVRPKRANPPKKLLSHSDTQSSSQSLALLYRPSVDIQASLAERRSFHYIQAQNMTDMLGKCEPDLWDFMVLQFSHSHPAVQQSLIALSSIYEVHERKNKQGDGNLTNLEAPERHALQQYNKAVKNLVQYLETANHDPKIVLMSCLIFTWIEIMQDNLDTAVRHLTCGLNILQDLGPSLQRSGGEGEPYFGDLDDIYGSMHRSFMRLRVQTALEGESSCGGPNRRPTEGGSSTGTVSLPREVQTRTCL